MRWWFMIVAVGCGRSTGPAPSAGSSTPVVAVESVSAERDASAPDEARAPAPCDPTPGVGVEGSHDRYPFEDPKTELWGYKTKAGAIAIPAAFEAATSFTPGGVADVRIRDGSINPWRFIDPSGKVIATPHKVDNGPDNFQEGFARIVDGGGKFGFINVAGTIVVAPQYDFAYPFCNGVSKVARGTASSYIDITGASTVGPKDDDRPAIPPSHAD